GDFRPIVARDQHLMCRPRLSATREKFSRGIVRKDRADHEQSRASADDRKRNPIDLAVKCKADDAHTAAANVDQTRRTSCDLICVRGATLQTFQQELAKPSWVAARECSTICVMDQCHAWARGGDSISANSSQKSPRAGVHPRRWTDCRLGIDRNLPGFQ